MAALPPGVSVHIGSHEFVGEIPDDLCPTAFLPPVAKSAAKPGKPDAE
jgi:hypothetical protein